MHRGRKNILLLVMSSILLTSCASTKYCELSPEEMMTLRASVRNFLRADLGDLYTYYDTEDSILDAVSERDGSCGILIIPGGDSEDGTSLLHGEGIVMFDREKLEPEGFLTFVW